MSTLFTNFLSDIVPISFVVYHYLITSYYTFSFYKKKNIIILNRIFINTSSNTARILEGYYVETHLQRTI